MSWEKAVIVPPICPLLLTQHEQGAYQPGVACNALDSNRLGDKRSEAEGAQCAYSCTIILFQNVRSLPPFLYRIGRFRFPVLLTPPHAHHLAVAEKPG